jgi:hypothetical protein
MNVENNKETQQDVQMEQTVGEGQLVHPVGQRVPEPEPEVRIVEIRPAGEAAGTPAPAKPIAQAPLRDFHDSFLSPEVRSRLMESSEGWNDHALSGDIRLITDGQNSFAVVPTSKYGIYIMKREQWGFEQAPAVEWREVLAWLKVNPESVITEYPLPHRVTLGPEQIEMLRRVVDPTYEAIHIEGETYVLSSGRVFQWKDHPRPEFIPAGHERGEELKRWLVEHATQQEKPERSGGADKDAEYLKVLHEIVDPHQKQGGIQQGEAMKAAQERGISQHNAMRLLKDRSHFRWVMGKSRKEGNRIFPLAPAEEQAEQREDAGF